MRTKVPTELELRLNETIYVKHLEPSLHIASTYPVIISYYSKFCFPSVNEDKNNTHNRVNIRLKGIKMFNRLRIFPGT